MVLATLSLELSAVRCVIILWECGTTSLFGNIIFGNVAIPMVWQHSSPKCCKIIGFSKRRFGNVVRTNVFTTIKHKVLLESLVLHNSKNKRLLTQLVLVALFLMSTIKDVSSFVFANVVKSLF